MEILITGVQLIALTGICIFAPVFGYLKLKWRAEAAERALEHEHQARVLIEQELAECKRALMNLDHTIPQTLEPAKQVG
jgi:hypothetical protein